MADGEEAPLQSLLPSAEGRFSWDILYQKNPGSKDSSKGPWVMIACDLFVFKYVYFACIISQKYIYWTELEQLL